jgi:hypothetical protein
MDDLQNQSSGWDLEIQRVISTERRDLERMQLLKDIIRTKS